MEKVNVKLFRPRRRKNGRSVASPFYHLRWSVRGQGQGQRSLNVRDRQVAEKLKADFIGEKERELSGIIAPRLMREAAGRALTEHLADFLAYLEGLNRSASHISHVGTRVEKLIADCGWRYLADVTAKSFEVWQREQSGTLAAKTLNEYRAAMYSLLAWLEEKEELVGNPFKRVKKVDGRGREKVKRRAARPEEMNDLLRVAGPYAVAYLAAVTTGLRRGELAKLEWGDLHLEVAQPVALVRAATTKNRQAAKVYLCRQLVAELKKLISPGMASNDVVLARRMPSTKQMRKHLAAAGIAYVDGQGRRLDFHALRMTFDTNLAIAGVPDAVRTKLMRHKSPRLTMEVYTDSERVPVSEAVEKLPEFGCLESGKEHTPKDAPVLVAGSPAVSVPVTLTFDKNGDKAPENIGESHCVSPLVLAGLEQSNGGERGIRTPDRDLGPITV